MNRKHVASTIAVKAESTNRQAFSRPFNYGNISGLLQNGADGPDRTAIHAFYQQTGQRGISLPDPVAMAVFLTPEIRVASSSHRVEIETAGEFRRGMTVLDRLNVTTDERNERLWSEAGTANVVWEIDIAGWKKLLFESLR